MAAIRVVDREHFPPFHEYRSLLVTGMKIGTLVELNVMNNM